MTHSCPTRRSSDLAQRHAEHGVGGAHVRVEPDRLPQRRERIGQQVSALGLEDRPGEQVMAAGLVRQQLDDTPRVLPGLLGLVDLEQCEAETDVHAGGMRVEPERSEEHTSELQSLMRISYAVFCLKKK